MWDNHNLVMTFFCLFLVIEYTNKEIETFGCIFIFLNNAIN